MCVQVVRMGEGSAFAVRGWLVGWLVGGTLACLPCLLSWLSWLSWLCCCSVVVVYKPPPTYRSVVLHGVVVVVFVVSGRCLGNSGSTSLALGPQKLTFVLAIIDFHCLCFHFHARSFSVGSHLKTLLSLHFCKINDFSGSVLRVESSWPQSEKGNDGTLLGPILPYWRHLLHICNGHVWENLYRTVQKYLFYHPRTSKG